MTVWKFKVERTCTTLYHNILYLTSLCIVYMCLYLIGVLGKPSMGIKASINRFNV